MPYVPSQWKFGVSDEGFQESLIGVVFSEGVLGVYRQFADIAGAIVCQAVTLGMAPELFNGIQMGGVGWQIFEKHVAPSSRPVSNQF